ncbi:MAG: GAF domain-containing protein [Deltaproteobacteria bacterium]|nr:GAF domain-containing protein [Deltaproteobacteria bacterium]
MIALCAILALSVPSDAKGMKTTGFAVSDPGGLLDISGLWLFHAGDNPAFARASIDDTRWDQKRVPTAGAAWPFRWAGYGWYRLHINVDTEVVGTDQMLSLGPARETVEIYVNGSLVAERGRFGSRPRGGARLLPLEAIVPGRLLQPGNNVIAVRVYDPTFEGGLTSGPILFGAPAQVRARVEARATTAIVFSIGLALISLCLGLGVLLARTRAQAQESGWLVAAAFAMAAHHLEGTGLFEASLPNLELASRLPTFAALVAAVCFGTYFSIRYDVRGPARLPIPWLLLAAAVIVALFVPAAWFYFAARPIVLGAALATTFYAAEVCGRSIRRKEPGSFVVFASLVVLIALVVADGLAASKEDLLPSLSSIGAVGVALIVTFVSVRQSSRDYTTVVQKMQALEKVLDERTGFGILDATVLSINSRRAFMNVAIHEAARELEVRRCSLVLAHDDGTLHIEASVGLPKHATTAPVQKESSIAHWVYEQGQRITNKTLPAELASGKRAGSYMTNAFVCQPIAVNGKTIGVLNVSDRHDGRPFGPHEENVVAQVGMKIAIVLARVQ